VNPAKLVALLCAIAGAGCLVAVVVASSPLMAALTVVGAALVALAANEAG
jgi:hypothetical protein